MLPGGFQVEVAEKLEIVGAGYRTNNICPSCLSTDRDRLVYLYLSTVEKIEEQPLKILHMSPEPSLYRVISKIKSIDYHIATKYAEGTYYPVNIEFFDLLAIPHQDEAFDMVICNHILEDPTVTSPKDRHRVFGQFDHVRIYGTDYKNRLESIGFHVDIQNPIDNCWPIQEVGKYALNPKENLYIANKIRQ